MPLLDVRNLQIQFNTGGGTINAVRGIDFSLENGRTLGVVGESGCGKSVTAMALMRLIREPGRVSGGEMLLETDGEIVDLATLEPMGPEIRSIRGNRMAMIFQEPMTSLNPLHMIGHQIMEPIMLHLGLTRRQARERAIEMLIAVGIPAAETRLEDYPHQLSGGMRQRVMIAMALSCNPSLLIADEPTTALDVTIQAQVLKLMNELRTRLGTSIVFITHDLGVVAQMADEVIVMYLGRIVEKASVKELFRNAQHPYTQGLMNSIPSMVLEKGERLVPIKGTVPNPMSVTRGCGFASRCPHVTERCRLDEPALGKTADGHFTACWLHDAAQGGGVSPS
ncbi:ABC transporter ATP-binding protein [Nitratireductor aquimarinus]|nr:MULTISPECIES: ABC transporter ATP-binding protein [Alphaproteobacteria]MBN7759432.1 ABC transporter ATP-binding protein [Nitratireductor aquimarinus]MBY6002227.1 ABC transporter ATP-binding protein [Tritonibacter mobilis]MBY6024683.1 ABC transporter ATP-binding protein [Nitratireductor sp. DP7N14-4]MCV0378358.1 ABC transporter ATP-binding protein [Nitratireductor sp.]